ncbi:hypothetical protein [Streptomyces sp. NBC_01353]|uniref:hypothetical protein n=1 Tax=Streptomyces sp. NBC_01353 TaxID=2903835 RepID=UPI002E31ACD2|nr:hypothetical protein [Streptomyces sp. NBC_01353]
MDTLAAVPRFAALTPAACILHGDFHPMTSECWGATLDWYLAHEHLGQAAARDAYMAAVERKMLDQHVRTRITPQR